MPRSNALRITATQIEAWASSRESQSELPLLVRRLVQATCETSALAIRSGDSVAAPGWDGVTKAVVSNPWVPLGQARWEMGCDADPQGKANEDFAKRVFQASLEEMAEATFVFVTPRRWRKRDAWQQLAQETAPWRAVRALDADDLEAWLERSPAVTLWFGELRGLSGSGIESTDSFWWRWRSQSRFPLTAGALLSDRDSAARRFDQLIVEQTPVISVEADSYEEAAAFACVQLAALGLNGQAVCVSEAGGWRFVDSNVALRVTVACSIEVAASRAPRDGQSLVVPARRGDRPDGPLGASLRGAASSDSTISIQRPSWSRFEEQLLALGEESSDAARLARSTGRSWSVYRRVRATNPAIRQPHWLSPSFMRTLCTLCLVGSWNSAKAGDRGCVETVDGRSYEELDLQLRLLHGIEDSPIVRIGQVWRAKSPLELLHLCASALTDSMKDRFFSVAEAVLTKPDPTLELDAEKRWMAAVYGKTRAESGIVIDAITDSLIKLSVYGERAAGDASAESLVGGVAALVRRVLGDADGERWLSVSSVLRELAEAAPDEFLAAVESSLRRPDRAVTRLLSESGGSSSFGRCWHSDLLWGLEVIAWAPERLSRVAAVLAKLCKVPLPGNWGNTPARTLQSLFRPWWPQTMATSKRRLEALDRLIRENSDPAWALLLALVPSGSQWASANAAPVWREDDAGKAELLNHFEPWYNSEIGARLVAQAAGSPERVAALIGSLDSFGGEYREAILRLAETAVAFDDDGRACVRDGLRSYLNWQSSQGRLGRGEPRTVVERLRPVYDGLMPHDAVKRNLWLFASSWIDLPDGRDRDHEKHTETLTRMRHQALAEVFDALGWDGIARLAAEAAAPGIVGWHIGKSALDAKQIARWLLERRASIGWATVDAVLRGLLDGMSGSGRTEVIAWTLSELRSRGAEHAAADLLLSAPFCPETWNVLGAFDCATQDRYWSQVVPGYRPLDAESATLAVEQLVKRGRPLAAFQLVMFRPETIGAVAMKELLDEVRSRCEPDTPFPDPWNLGKAIAYVETSGMVPRRDLALLEFAFFGLLEHTEHGTRSLYAELLSDPALFIELVCMSYRARNGESNPIDDSLKAAARVAGSVLHRGRGVPGQRSDGTIDREVALTWVGEVRRLAAETDRAEVADITIGGWLSCCLPDGEGVWLHAAVAEILDDEKHDNIRRGFYSGVLNNRGVTTRAMGDGGTQERDLAAKFRDRAGAIEARYPRLSATVGMIADHYEREAKFEDDQVALRDDGIWGL
jgi:hypothetical protein